ncbi:MAG TPA: hypothetical protein H9673_08880 [Candidatus Adamsella sp.]|nr:hypothetical protein [Candidatus Adamsella sp.]
MQINAVSNSFFNTKIKHTSFGDKEYKHTTSKPTDKSHEDLNKLEIYSHGETSRDIDMSKIFEANILGRSKNLSKEAIRQIEAKATRDEMGENPSDAVLLTYLTNGGDPAVLTKDEAKRLEPYLFLD